MKRQCLTEREIKLWQSKGAGMQCGGSEESWWERSTEGEVRRGWVWVLSMSVINRLQGSGSHTVVGWGARCPGTARKEGTIWFRSQRLRHRATYTNTHTHTLTNKCRAIEVLLCRLWFITLFVCLRMHRWHSGTRIWDIFAWVYVVERLVLHKMKKTNKKQSQKSTSKNPQKHLKWNIWRANSGWFTVINKQLNHLVVTSHSYSSNTAILVKFHVCNHW